jgi:hypothetical protein
MNGAKERLARKVLHEGLSQKVAKDQLGQHSKEHEGGGDAERSEETCVEHQPTEVFGSVKDHLGIGGEGIPLMERDPDHVHERNHPEQTEDGQRGREQYPAQPVRLHQLTPPAPRC